ncbi:MAG: hypothetical protein L0I83_05160, partial [Enterobacterales bacterium]|nr:hypothetical protein [Enterobacterales bacterium]
SENSQKRLLDRLIAHKIASLYASQVASHQSASRVPRPLCRNQKQIFMTTITLSDALILWLLHQYKAKATLIRLTPLRN